MVLGAARRFLALLAAVGGVTLLGSLAIGLVAGASLRRSLALGFYLMGSFVLLTGFFLGNRGVLRAEGGAGAGADRPFGFLGPRRVRSATADERRESISIAAVVISLGVALLMLAIVADDENDLL